jgi:hypothetical protein
LTEIALMWNLMIIESLPPRPLILIGDGWQSVLDQVFTKLGVYTSDKQRALLSFAPDIETAARMLESSQV